jgi:cysteine desulfurase/selenocysteine lyase
VTEADIQRIRADFAFAHAGSPIYLDSAATAQKPRAVVDAIVRYHERYAANVHRGVYRIAEEATGALEAAREKVRGLLGAPSAQEVIFTSGTTAATNLVAYAWGMKGGLAPGDEIVVTAMEHHANLIPWYFLRQQRGAVIRFVGLTPDGALDLDELDRLLGPRTKLVAVTHCSNVLGTLNPVAEIARRAHAVGALCFVDGAQAAPHLPVDVAALGCDFYAFSGHKLLGPTGIGALYGRRAVLEELEPFLGGGEMIREVREDGARWAELPWRLEAGTPNIAGAIGLGAAVDYLQGIGLAAVRAHEVELTAYALARLAEVPELRIFGPASAEARGGLVSFALGAVHPHDVASILDAEADICVRAGHHCCQPLMARLGVAATVRASFHVYTLRAEIDRLITGLHAVRARLGAR